MTVLTLQLVAAGNHCSATGKNAGHSITSPSCPMEPSIGGYPGYPTTFLLISAASDIPQNQKSSSCIPIITKYSIYIHYIYIIYIYIIYYIYIYTPLNPILSHYIPIDHSSTESVGLSLLQECDALELRLAVWPDSKVCMGTHTKNIHSSPFPIHKCQGPGKVYLLGCKMM